MRVQHAILKTLSKERQGLSVKQMFVRLVDIEDITTLYVMASTMASRGLLYKDGKVTCGECGAQHLCYRISEKGRIRLLEYE